MKPIHANWIYIKNKDNSKMYYSLKNNLKQTISLYTIKISWDNIRIFIKLFNTKSISRQVPKSLYFKLNEIIKLIFDFIGIITNNP